MKSQPAKGGGKQWRLFAGLAVCLILAGFFYLEENWRGQRAWDNCKRELRARGIDPNWASYVPAPVPDNENVFGVPEMQQWFGGTGAGWAGLARRLPSLTFPGVEIDSNATRMVVAHVTIGLRGTTAPDGFTALRWDDASSRMEAARLLANALGPTARSPQSSIGIGLMLRTPEEVQAARIFLQCQKAPAEKELQEFFPDTILHAKAGLPERVLQFESDGDNSYRVTMPVLVRVADFLAWSDGLEPQVALIRQALQRPSARLQGYYGNPGRIPAPNFRAIRTLVQTLGARAQCHLLLGQPDKAFSELTLVDDLCRIMEQSRPMSLVPAMLNVAVRGFYAAQVAEGLRLHAWREPELAALQARLKSMDVLSPVKQAYFMNATMTFRTLDNVPSAGLVKRSILAGFCPRGWGYQHMATRMRFDFDRLASLDTTNHIVFAVKVRDAGEKSEALGKGWPYTFVASLEPGVFARACLTAGHNQATIDQTLIACALERYHFARGDYPETLDALVPRFLENIPHDVSGGGPIHYRRAAGGGFILYSIGPDGVDGGGVGVQSPTSTDGDWVWPD